MFKSDTETEELSDETPETVTIRKDLYDQLVTSTVKLGIIMRHFNAMGYELHARQQKKTDVPLEEK